MLKLEGVSTAKIVLFHQGSTELLRCEKCVFFLPVIILTGVARRLLGPHDTLPCVLICSTYVISSLFSYYTVTDNEFVSIMDQPIRLLFYTL